MTSTNASQPTSTSTPLPSPDRAGLPGAYTPPGVTRLIALTLGLGVIATCVFGVWLGSGGGVRGGAGSVAWFVLAFEAVSVIAGLFAVLIGLGRFANAPGLALLCAAGSVGAGTLLGHVGSGRALLPMWFLGVRGLLTVGLLVASAWAVLARNPGPAVRWLVWCAAFGAPLAAIMGGMWVMRGSVLALPGLAILLGGFVVFIIALGLFAGAVHAAIRAFEVCDEDPVLR